MTKFYLLICNKTNIGQDSMMKITHRLDTQNNTPIMKDRANFCNLNYTAILIPKNFKLYPHEQVTTHKAP